MRYCDLFEAKRPVLTDYIGMDPTVAEQYLKAAIPPELADIYQRSAEHYNFDFATVLDGHKDNLRRKKESRD
jgi:hypothetical protein